MLGRRRRRLRRHRVHGCDGDPAINPAAVDICGRRGRGLLRGRSAVRACTDGDGDGYGTGAACSTVDCNDANSQINPGATEICDGLDNNCVGGIDEGFDADIDGWTTCAGDCDDGDPAISPSAPEVCDGVDINCFGGIDEGFDGDGDGWTTCAGDNDGAGSIYPEPSTSATGWTRTATAIDEHAGDGFEPNDVSAAAYYMAERHQRVPRGLPPSSDNSDWS